MTLNGTMEYFTSYVLKDRHKHTDFLQLIYSSPSYSILIRIRADRSFLRLRSLSSARYRFLFVLNLHTSNSNHLFCNFSCLDFRSLFVQMHNSIENLSLSSIWVCAKDMLPLQLFVLQELETSGQSAFHSRNNNFIYLFEFTSDDKFCSWRVTTWSHEG